MLGPGDLVPLAIEKPAGGGRMIARMDGRVVLVGGAIPGEQVIARIERVSKGVAYAAVTTIDQPSPDRREPAADPLCGGCLYAHISYSRQLNIKAQVVEDAFARIGHMPLPSPFAVAPSPEHGYRMRARMHARNGRIGFFREGTHDVCDARATGQLLPETCDVIEHLSDGLRSLGIHAAHDVEISENIDARERVLLLDLASSIDERPLEAFREIDGLTGLVVSHEGSGNKPTTLFGDPHVVDVLPVGERTIIVRRHVEAFFQGNRYLLGDLVHHVLGLIKPDTAVVDLYAGTGVFAIALAMAHGARVTAVEGDRAAARDLIANARQAAGGVQPLHEPVEAFLAARRQTPDAVILDPPRTGVSREAMEGIVRLGAGRLVYVSCDPATLARDSRRLVDAGYEIAQASGFDLFPNTPHVETVVVFDLRSA